MKDRIFALILVMALTAIAVFLIGRNMTFPSLPFTQSGRDRATIENAHREKMLNMEAQVALAETTAELERLRLEIERIQKEHKRELERIDRDATIGAVTKVIYEGIMVAAVGGGIAVVLIYSLRRAVTIYPNHQGQFPLLLGRSKDKEGKKAWLIADPNRSVSSVTAIGKGEPQVTHYLPEGQAQATSQAQMVQLAAAISSSESQPETHALVGRRMMGRALPRVESAPWEPSHVERLLTESGELEDVYDQ